jgi:hypothetical protein
MRTHLVAALAAALCTALALPTVATAAVPTVDPDDDKVTGGITYVRHDLGTDATIKVCNDESLDAFGAFTQNNEPFSVVDPSNPALIVTGWNDYCSDWMGLGFSTDAGETWTDSLVPGYLADDSTEGAASPEHIRTNTASDPVGAFSPDGSMFYFGFIAYNGLAGPKTNSDVAVARYEVRDPSDPRYDDYPIDYLDTVRIGKGPAAANFFGIFNDKEMIEVDQTDGPTSGNVYMCWTKFPGFGTPTIRFRASHDGGETWLPPVNLTEGGAGQGCDITAEADGDVYVLWRDFEFSSSHKNFGVSFARSTDGGESFSRGTKIADLTAYNPFDTARDCGDGIDACPSEFVFARVPLEPRITSDPTGELPGVYAVVQAVDPETVEPSDTTYSSAGSGTGDVGQSFVFLIRSLDDGRTWSDPYKVADLAVGHQFFPDADALDGRLAVVWQDSREDNCYSVQRPISNNASAKMCDLSGVNSYAAVSTDGVHFGSSLTASSVGQMPQYEMFDSASVPFLGDYNWIDLIERNDGSLFGYLSWTDNRDVVPGTDPRETVQDGFDVTGWFTNADGELDRHFNAGGYDQNIYGTSLVIP